MVSFLNLYSTNTCELHNFLQLFYNKDVIPDNNQHWKNSYNNPLEMIDLISSIIDNNNKFPSISIWASIDKGVFINIRDNNLNSFIKYLYERYP